MFNIRECVNPSVRPFVLLLVGIGLLASPGRAFAGSEAAQSERDPLVAMYQKETEKEVLAMRAEAERQKTVRQALLAQVEASAKQLAPQALQPASTGEDASIARLKESMESVRLQQTKDAQALRALRDGAVKRITGMAFDDVNKAEKAHAEPAAERDVHVKVAMHALRQQRRDSLAALDGVCREEIAKADAQVSDAIAGWEKKFGTAKKPEAGLDHRIVHRKGVSVLTPVAQEEH